jgi:N-acetylmuramoyl-L-alanine amidase
MRLFPGRSPVSLVVLLAAATPTPAAAAQIQDSLLVHVQYPPAGAALTASDSTFVFGRVDGAHGSDVELSVNGSPTQVHASGGWLAFVPIEPDSFTFSIRAVAGDREGSASHTVWVPPPPNAPGESELGYRPETIEPTGPVEAYAGDTVRVRVVAAPDQRVVARIGDLRKPLVPERSWGGNAGRQVFGSADPVDGAAPSAKDTDRWLGYSGDVYLRISGSLSDSLFLDLESADGSTRSVPVTTVDYIDPTDVRVAVLDDDTAGTGRTDGRVVARAGPSQGYTMLLPNGTLAGLGRRHGDQREIVLGPGVSAWVAASEAIEIDAPRPESAVSVVRTRIRGDSSEVVVPLSSRLPFRIEQRLDPVRYTVSIYGATSDTDWVRYTDDPMIESIDWSQPARGVYRLDIALGSEQAWGYRTYWEGSHLVIAFRHPPSALDDHRFRSRLHGVRVIVDPGHNPDPGAIGPTGLEEREANLAIALELAEILETRGAEAVLTRADPDSTLGLYDRTSIATRMGGDVFVSIHNNALPDGVNPFVNNGTSTYFYHPQSRPLAEAIQRELRIKTELPDFGVNYGNLAVLRMNEMVSVLVEGAFMMIPEQEALLRKTSFRRRIATAVADGIERFLESRDR